MFVVMLEVLSVIQVHLFCVKFQEIKNNPLVSMRGSNSLGRRKKTAISTSQRLHLPETNGSLYLKVMRNARDISSVVTTQSIDPTKSLLLLYCSMGSFLFKSFHMQKATT
jgi:hypothetical protein